ncbi:MAG: hypothetical protein BGO11_18550 [Solirubrobacterales bacterium 70-9]|nr:MAG: hypothetical protein BGO11_18550 [Solirubrobacterales bacterium 70-9]
MTKLSDDLRSLGAEAYIYLYSLVMMEATRRQMTNADPEARPGMGPPNQFHHIRQFPAADFRAVVRPNFDTLYSSAWIDLRGGPVRVVAPDTDDRYYMLPMLDMWTDVFANPGKRTTGTGAQEFVLVGPGSHSSSAPVGATVIKAPTPWVWLIGRIQTNGPADYAAVNAVQDGLAVEPLGELPAFAVDPDADTATEPLRLVNAMNAVEYFSYAAGPLAEHPPHATDFSVLARIAALGIVPGEKFDPGRFDDAGLERLEAGIEDAKHAMAGGVAGLGRAANGWTSTVEGIGVYGNGYLKRALVAEMGLGANPPEDAVYPLLLADADGKPIDGDNDYVVHFEPDALPPVAAFWSITMYDAEGFQVANELDRFAIGDRDPLAYNDDGSLDIYVQRENPGPERESNWLPAGPGPSGITMRLYAPARPVLSGTWAPPPVRRAG